MGTNQDAETPLEHKLFISGQQSCAERAQQAWTPSVDRLAYEAGPWLASGNVDFGRAPTTLTGKSSALCPNCLCKQYGLFQNPAFLLGVWNWGT